ncbi:MAG: beta-N-acetylhexosaminidase [Desulfobacterales bacterium]|nr:MAG: beta-N-acetylhexosaminidase [Desulfobacterales bacterium]
MAGQRLMVGFEGTELNKDLEFLIDTIKVGGIVLFARNLKNPEQIGHLCASVNAFARSCGQPPPFIAIDQEGGQVARLRQPFTQFPGNAKMKNIKDAEYFARVTAEELKGVGINMNLAPVLDIAPEDIHSIMAERSFGSDTSRVSELGATVIDNLQKRSVMSVAKHFPGIGRTTLDSHLDMPNLDIDINELASTDLVPFEAAISKGVAGIMLSHIRYKKIDAEWPASLSVSVARDLLRSRMNFSGVVMTDDLDMGAIKKHYNIQSVIRQLLTADIDIALICHKGPDIEKAFEEILNILDNSRLLKAKGEVSVKRIMELKREYLEIEGLKYSD